jgi:hypothetical protein
MPTERSTERGDEKRRLVGSKPISPPPGVQPPDIFARPRNDVIQITVKHSFQEFDGYRSAIHGGQQVLMLALRIAIAWTALSFLCLAVWILFLKIGRFFGSGKAEKFHPHTAAGFWP